jgi:hypothetical protein
MSLHSWFLSLFVSTPNKPGSVYLILHLLLSSSNLSVRTQRILAVKHFGVVPMNIEYDIPVPKHARSKYPFPLLEIGSSIFLPDGVTQRISCAAHAYGRRHGKKFKVATVDGGARIWRVA